VAQPFVREADITFVKKASADYTKLIDTPPNGVAGDMLVMFIAMDGSASARVDGWNAFADTGGVGGFSANTTTVCVQAFWRRWDSGDVNYLVQFDDDEEATIAIVPIQEVGHIFLPESVAINFGTGTQPVTIGLTTDGPNRIVMYACAVDAARTADDVDRISGLLIGSNFHLCKNAGSATSGVSLQVWSHVMNTAGTSPSHTIEPMDASDQWATLSLSLREVPTEPTIGSVHWTPVGDSAPTYGRVVDGATDPNALIIEGMSFTVRLGAADIHIADSPDFATATKQSQATANWQNEVIRMNVDVSTVGTGDRWIFITDAAGVTGPAYPVTIYPSDTDFTEDVQTASGYFLTPTTTGVETVVSGLTFQPKGVILFAVDSASDVLIQDGVSIGYGVSDGVSNLFVGARQQTGSLSGDAIGDTSGVIRLLNREDNLTTPICIADSVTMDKNGFSIDFTTTTKQVLVMWWAIGGADVEAAAGEGDVSAKQVSGLPFSPDMAMMAQNGKTVSTTVGSGAVLGFGVAEFPDKSVEVTTQTALSQSSVSFDLGSTSSTFRSQTFPNDALMGYTSGRFVWGLHLWRSFLGGFSWSHEDGDDFIYLALKVGTKIRHTSVGTFNKLHGATPVSDNFPDVGFPEQSSIINFSGGWDELDWQNSGSNTLYGGCKYTGIGNDYELQDTRAEHLTYCKWRL
jgi:hypothetical protein